MTEFTVLKMEESFSFGTLLMGFMFFNILSLALSFIFSIMDLKRGV